MGTPIDPSVNIIAPLETQQVANDAQSNLGLTSAAWIHFKRKKIEEKWKSICKYCEKNLVVIQGQVRSICTITLEPVSFEQ